MVTLDEYHTHIFSKEFRVAYYCGNLQKKEIIISTIPKEILSDTITPLTVHTLTNYNMSKCDGTLQLYLNDMRSYFSRIKHKIDNNTYFYFIYGDHIEQNDPPCLRKARFAKIAMNNEIQKYNNCTRNNICQELPAIGTSGGNHILLKLNMFRHWTPIHEVIEHDIQFTQKNNTLIWRGSSTGNRTKYMKYLQNHPNKNINIKFTKLCQMPEQEKSTYILAQRLTIKELLTYKFILSMEGNDVATDLKWILYSNSVVFMCKPTKCSWAMEELLIPYIHYIPLKSDYSDLEEKYNWALQHLPLCNEIAQNSKKYMQHFLNEESENTMIDTVILKYMNTINIKCE
jgi:hypothetical protein